MKNNKEVIHNCTDYDTCKRCDNWELMIREAHEEVCPGKTAQQKLELLLTDKTTDEKLTSFFSRKVDEWIEKLKESNGN